MSVGAVFGSLFAVLLALGFVLVLAWFAIKGLRKWQDRFQGPEGEGERPIRFLRAMPLGPGERVAMIEVRGEVMLIGVTAGGINLLARWPVDAPPPRELPRQMEP